MSDHNPKAMNKEELEKYIEKDFLPGLLSSLPNVPDLTGENARLKAEVERLAVAADWKTPARKIQALEAEVERLRKAGDGLYKSMLEIGCNEMADNFQYDDWWGSMRAWQSAKEGKQP